MINLSSEYFKCDDVPEKFGQEKLTKRFDILLDEVKCFLDANSLTDKVAVNRIVLANIIRDYFTDIMRLKDFHTDIEKANSEKVIAYTSYWFLRRKPIQIKEEAAQDKELAIVNERFILQYIFDYLSEREKGRHILLRENKGLKNFAKLMLYYLVYRKIDAQSLEMIITAFLAGQIYENVDKDISGELHPFDC
jgi:hypothetical protein